MSCRFEGTDWTLVVVHRFMQSETLFIFDKGLTVKAGFVEKFHQWLGTLVAGKSDLLLRERDMKNDFSE